MGSHCVCVCVCVFLWILFINKKWIWVLHFAAGGLKLLILRCVFCLYLQDFVMSSFKPWKLWVFFFFCFVLGFVTNEIFFFQTKTILHSIFLDLGLLGSFPKLVLAEYYKRMGITQLLH